jgi:hypothetical protein
MEVPVDAISARRMTAIASDNIVFFLIFASHPGLDRAS